MARLLDTKLRPPPLRDERVYRPEPYEDLADFLTGVVLVSAPPGFGKSTLVMEWLTRQNRRFAWYSLDRYDGDVGLFGEYVGAAVGSLIGRDSGQVTMPDAPTPDSRTLIATLVDDLARAPTAAALVLILMVLSVAVMLGSAFLSNEARMVVWALLLVMWLITMIRLGGSVEMLGEDGLRFSDSMVERFGLFVIIVLGEVVVGVVDGLSNAERNAETIATAMFGLIIGFGLWWNYFDLTGRRLPRADAGGAPIWLTGQFPLTLSIAAAGAAMVSLIQHATDDRAPVATTWLLAGSVALGFVSLAVIVRTLQDYDRLDAVYRPTSIAMFGAAAAALLIAAWRPAPLVLVVALATIHSVVWVFAVSRWLGTEEAAAQGG